MGARLQNLQQPPVARNLRSSAPRSCEAWSTRARPSPRAWSGMDRADGNRWEAPEKERLFMGFFHSMG